MLQSFDLEIAREIPEGTKDWKALLPLGITCAAAYDGRDYAEFHDFPQLDQQHSRALVQWMLEAHNRGYQFLTWNGCSFDFHVLAFESQMWRECVQLCLNHIDLMLYATMSKGWFVGLDSALQGHGIESKQHRVQLNDGTFIDDMSGGKAPVLWAKGERDAVLTYLRADVERPYLLVQDLMRKKSLAFVSSRGRLHHVYMSQFYSVFEMLQMTMADNSWMDPESRPTKAHFYNWMLPYLTEKEKRAILGEKDWLWTI